MTFNLKRPLVFFDLETTGLDIGKARIVEISLIKVQPDGTETERTQLLDPGMHIPEECTAIHGFTDADVSGKPKFEDIADELLAFIGDADLAGFNSNKFDIPLLAEEFLRCGRRMDFRNRYRIDVQNIFHKMEPRNLRAAYKFYCHEELTNAHTANADTRATVEILKAQIEKYDGTDYEDPRTKIKSQPIVNDVKALCNFTADDRNVDLVGHIVFNDKDEEVFNFGKHKNKPVALVFQQEPAYYDWMMKADFPLYTKEVITRIYDMVRLELHFSKKNEN